MVDTLVAVAPPVKPAPVGKDQAYFVPDGTIPLVTSAGVTVKLNHIAVEICETAATGFTITVTVNVVAFPQADVFGVIV